MNYYFKLKPTEKQREEIIEMINKDDFDNADNEAKKYLKKFLGREVNEYKFLFKFHGGFYYNNKETLRNFLSSSNVVILDSYDNIIDFQTFWDKVINSLSMKSNEQWAVLKDEIIQNDEIEFIECLFC